MSKQFKKIRVLLADDHALVRAGIRSLMETFAYVDVVGEAASGSQALDLVALHNPDIAMLDVSMATLNGLEAAERIVAEFPATKVLILSLHSNEQYVTRALRIGVAGYLLKDAPPAELDVALRTVHAGQTYLSGAISQELIREHLARVSDAEQKLTSRQREILQLIAESKNTKEIAAILNVSTKTVEAHRAQVMERLNIHDVPGLVRYAIRHGLTPN